uniref:Probable membrane transporter protein n=1 Tax=Desulfovibrio desulfuricans (strain ATCC 27774 / DSM 6949 / MB) TaxID=525146 RepID=B8J214_DESDA
MYFPTAGIECNPFIPFGAALCISFFTSMGGISGAFLLLPFHMSVLGYVNPSVSATNQFFNILACPPGVWRYWREGRLIWPLALTVAAGTLPGVFLGALIRVNWLPDPDKFKIFAGLVLLYVGGRMARAVWKGRQAESPGMKLHGAPGTSDAAVAGKDDRCAGPDAPANCCRVLEWNTRSLSFAFQEKKHVVSTPRLALLSLVVGLIGGVYGIGGGAIMAPFLVSFFALPVYAVAGATLFATFLTSVAGVSFYSLLAPLYPGMAIAPDWRMGILVGLGGMCGMYLGARCQKHVPATALKCLLAVILLFTALRYLGQSF